MRPKNCAIAEKAYLRIFKGILDLWVFAPVYPLPTTTTILCLARQHKSKFYIFVIFCSRTDKKNPQEILAIFCAAAASVCLTFPRRPRNSGKNLFVVTLSNQNIFSRDD